MQALKLSCGTVIRQSDGSQDELVRLYNDLVSDHAQGITYSNFSRYLEEQQSSDFEDEEQDGDEFDTMDEIIAPNRESNSNKSMRKLSGIFVL
jgi:hypothetical protein